MSSPAPRTTFLSKIRIWHIVVALITLIVLAPVTWLGLFLLNHHYAGMARLQRAIAEADRLDLGWRREELERNLITVSPREDSARLIRSIHRSLPTEWPSSELRDLKVLSRHPVESPLDADEIALLRRELREVESMVMEARRLANFPVGQAMGGRFSPGRQLPEAEWRLRRLLELDAVLQALDGECDNAIRSVHARLNVARSMGNTSSVYAMVLRAGIAARSADLLLWVLGNGAPSDAALAGIQDEFQVELEFPTILTAMRGERANRDSWWAALGDGSLTAEQFLETFDRWLLLKSVDPVTYVDAIDNQIRNYRITRYSSPPQENRAAILEYMNRYVEIAKMPFHLQLDEVKQFESEMSDPAQLHWSKHHFFGLMSGYFESLLEHRARLLCGLAAVAVERFRIAKKRWPDDWSEIVPDYLNAIPIDLFNGNPLRLDRTDDGLIVYSVGLNKLDDGGKIVWDHSQQVYHDIGFRLWDTDKRAAGN